MPTTKKSVAKKPASKKTATKATSVAKVTTKKAPAKKTAKKTSAKQAPMRSFRLSKDQVAFSSFRVTKQTVYWVILVVFIIFVQLWILKLQIDVATLLDQQQSELQSSN